MQLGTLLPLGDIGGDPAVVREYAQTAEAIGYHFVEAPDHVLGVNAASRPGWDRNSSEDLFHDPFVLFGYLAGCTQKLGFSTGVLILPQRQTVLVAKQAACLDALCDGRFRLGIGVGWNEVEFTGLNENFHNRGRRSEEQMEVMQKLWAEPHVSFKGRWHKIEDAGINPLPASGKVPVWFGGHHERTLPRIAKMGDGWMPNAYPPDQSALEVFGELRRLTKEAGRDPAARRDRGLGVDGHRRRSRLGAGNPVLEGRRRLSSVPDDDLQPPPSPAHPRPQHGRPPGGIAPLSLGGRRSTLAATAGREKRRAAGRRRGAPRCRRKSPGGGGMVGCVEEARAVLDRRRPWGRRRRNRAGAMRAKPIAAAHIAQGSRVT